MASRALRRDSAGHRLEVTQGAEECVTAKILSSIAEKCRRRRCDDELHVKMLSKTVKALEYGAKWQSAKRTKC